MIGGILLLYIGLKNGYPVPYLVGCWAIILFGAVKMISGVYEAGKKNGRTKEED